MTISIPGDLKRRAKSVAALRNETVSAVICRALEHYVAEAASGGVPSPVDPALEALEEAMRVQEMMREEYGVRPEGWSAEVIRAVREEI